MSKREAKRFDRSRLSIEPLERRVHDLSMDAEHSEWRVDFEDPEPGWAFQEGMLSLRKDAVRKMLLGETTAEEVLRETSAD